MILALVSLWFRPATKCYVNTAWKVLYLFIYLFIWFFFRRRSQLLRSIYAALCTTDGIWPPYWFQNVARLGFLRTFKLDDDIYDQGSVILTSACHLWAEHSNWRHDFRIRAGVLTCDPSRWYLDVFESHQQGQFQYWKNRVYYFILGRSKAYPKILPLGREFNVPKNFATMKISFQISVIAKLLWLQP